MCIRDRRDTVVYRAPKDDDDWENEFGPRFEFCLGKLDGNGPWMLRHCVLFPFKYTKLLDVVYKTPPLRMYVQELIYRIRSSIDQDVDKKMVKET